MLRLQASREEVLQRNSERLSEVVSWASSVSNIAAALGLGWDWG